MSVIFLPVILFVIQVSTIENENVINTMAMPVTKKTIVIDAGHGGEDGGAVSKNGISEASINLAIALKLQNLLECSRSYSSSYKV